MSETPLALILSGSGRYADPWHPYPETTAALTGLARDAGWDVSVDEDIDARLADGLDGIDLLIVNAGDPRGRVAEDHALIEKGRESLMTGFDRGMSLLGIHAAASSLGDYPQYRKALGGAWIPDHSWHPPFGEVHVRPCDDQIVEGLGNFTVLDERYTDLVTDPDIEPLAETWDDEGKHVLAWFHQYGKSLVVYDALGHDVRSYDSEGHKDFLRRILCWLLPRHNFDD